MSWVYWLGFFLCVCCSAVPTTLLRAHVDCPCEDASLCDPISGPPVREKEVFGFGQPSLKFDFWKQFVTTVAWVDSPEFLCEAHKNGIRVVMAAPSVILTANETARMEWAQNAAQMMQSKFMDGIVFDFEDPLPANSTDAHNYALLIHDTSRHLHSLSPSYQVSTCVAWAPDDIDGRGYDMLGMATASDVLYVMDYDTRSQVFGRCLADANSPLAGAMRGVKRFLDIGIEPQKLVLGQPWYGYRYPCLEGTSPTDKFCEIPFVPFRGVNCSDAAGSEHPFAEISKLLLYNSTTGRRWDNSTMSPYFNTVELTKSGDSEVCQYWFDDVESLTLKYQFANSANLRGVGPYMFSFLDDDNASQTEQMWLAFNHFLKD